jgi:hypothetical protein
MTIQIIKTNVYEVFPSVYNCPKNWKYNLEAQILSKWRKINMVSNISFQGL